MQQLSGMDATFLYMESGTNFGHVCSLSVYARPGDDPDFEPFEAFRSQLASRLHLIEPFRRRLVQVPFGLNRPYWIEDPAFDLDFHVRNLAIPAPGNTHQLAEQVARIIGRPLDRSRPLWEVYVIEGLEDGDFAILTKIHHATIDGASGVELLTIMLDSEPHPSGADVVIPDASSHDKFPTQTEMFRIGLVTLVGDPLRMARLGFRALGDLAEATRNANLAAVARSIARRIPRPRSDEQRDRPPLLPLKAAPRTPFNKTITAHRRFAIRSVPLEDIKTIKNRLGVTVNDVVLAVCAGALRQYLTGHEQLPDEPLVAMIPVSIRGDDEKDRWTNRVSGMLANLPTNVDDPVERVRAVHNTMVAAKRQFDMMPADLIAEFTQFATPALATRAIRLAAATRISDRLNPPINLIISNVPGPRQPLYMAGATMKHFYPVSTIIDGQGLNITVQSYLDTLDFGLVACRELVPDLWELLDMCVDEIQILLAACTPDNGAKPGKRSRQAPSRKSAMPPASVLKSRSGKARAAGRSGATRMAP